MPAYDIKKNADGHIGFSLIINNFLFTHPVTGEPEPRQGSDLDVERITKSLQTVNFKTKEPHSDQTASQMKELMNGYAKYNDFSNYSCFACVIMSHGAPNYQIMGVDNQTVHLIDDLIAPLKDCATLKGKPKLFFVNVCRGQHPSRAFEVSDKENKKQDFDSMMQQENKTPNGADILIHYSSVDSFYSDRDPSKGSLYIELLCQELDGSAQAVNVNLYDLLGDVNNHMATLYSDGKMPQITTWLRKRFYFNCNDASGINLAKSLCLTENKEKQAVLKWDGEATGSIDRNLFAVYDPDSVRELKITHTNSSLIPKNTFAELRNLEKLDLGFNKIEAIDAQTFTGLGSLKLLWISGNKIKSIPGNTFSELKKLGTLRLDHNQIEAIDSGLFRGLGSLKVLYIHGNGIKSISGNTFVELGNLELLSLWQNQIEGIDETTFQGLGSLRELSIHDNRIKLIGANAFGVLKNLELLTVHNNQLESVDELTFNGLVSVKSLVILHNKLKSIPINTFSELEKLEELWLDHGLNREGLFAGLGSLKKVNGKDKF
jgi:hypothetical protein